MVYLLSQHLRDLPGLLIKTNDADDTAIPMEMASVPPHLLIHFTKRTFKLCNLTNTLFLFSLALVGVSPALHFISSPLDKAALLGGNKSASLIKILGSEEIFFCFGGTRGPFIMAPATISLMNILNLLLGLITLLSGRDAKSREFRRRRRRLLRSDVTFL